MAEYEKVIAVTEKVIKQVSFYPIRFMLVPNSSQRDLFDLEENKTCRASFCFVSEGVYKRKNWILDVEDL